MKQQSGPSYFTDNHSEELDQRKFIKSVDFKSGQALMSVTKNNFMMQQNNDINYFKENKQKSEFIPLNSSSAMHGIDQNQQMNFQNVQGGPIQRRNNSKGGNQPNQMQMSHPNLITLNQIESNQIPVNVNQNGVQKRSDQHQTSFNQQPSNQVTGTNNLLHQSQNNINFKKILSNPDEIYQIQNTQSASQINQNNYVQSSRFKNINDRIKKTSRNGNRRIQIPQENKSTEEKVQVAHQANLSNDGLLQQELQNQKQIYALVNQQNSRLNSTQRFQNNNVSSANPKKGMVTPRQKNMQIKSFQQSKPLVLNGPPQIATDNDINLHYNIANQQQVVQSVGSRQDSSQFQIKKPAQINTQRNGYNPQAQINIIYGNKEKNNNLPLIRTDSLDLKNIDNSFQQAQPRYGALLSQGQNQQIPQTNVNSKSKIMRQSFYQTSGNPNDAAQPQIQIIGNNQQMRQSLTKFNTTNQQNQIQNIRNNKPHQELLQTSQYTNASQNQLNHTNVQNTNVFNSQISLNQQAIPKKETKITIQQTQPILQQAQQKVDQQKISQLKKSMIKNQMLLLNKSKHSVAENIQSSQEVVEEDESTEVFRPTQKPPNASSLPRRQPQQLDKTDSKVVQRVNSIIPEVSERDELTVNETTSLKLDFPIDNSIVKQKLLSDQYLTDYEKTEIDEYQEIYYLCENELKLKPTKLERLVNNGFDDDEGYYKIQKNDHIAYRYQLIEIIGKGAFGQVIKCLDHKHKDLVAIKLVKNQKKYYYQAAVEAKLLLLLKESDPDNVERVVKIRDYFVFRNHLCCVFELFSINLYEFIKMYNYTGFEYGLIRRFAIQLLSALRYMKYLGIIHCDLKPENILLKRKDKSGIVVADFGSGCLENEIVYTYIQSRFYRAPDIILGLFPYTQQIDMWSFGCIMIELYTGFPLFPGTNEKEQLKLIIDVIGMPSQQVLKNSQRKQLFSQFKDTAVPAALEVLTQDQKEERLNYIMTKLRQQPDPQFVNFIGKCLEWDPNKRLTPEDGLQHEWIIKGLPPNIILHNPHNNPYKRTSNNSQSSVTKKGTGHQTNPSLTKSSHNNVQIQPSSSAVISSNQIGTNQSNQNPQSSGQKNSNPRPLQSGRRTLRKPTSDQIADQGNNQRAISYDVKNNQGSGYDNQSQESSQIRGQDGVNFQKGNDIKSKQKSQINNTNTSSQLSSRQSNRNQAALDSRQYEASSNALIETSRDRKQTSQQVKAPFTTKNQAVISSQREPVHLQIKDGEGSMGNPASSHRVGHQKRTNMVLSSNNHQT